MTNYTREQATALPDEAISFGTDTITDTANLVSLTNTGAIVCDSSTTINGLPVESGSTQNVFNGTLGDLEIVSSIADFYGDINVTLEYTDSESTTHSFLL